MTLYIKVITKIGKKENKKYERNMTSGKKKKEEQLIGRETGGRRNKGQRKTG